MMGSRIRRTTGERTARSDMRGSSATLLALCLACATLSGCQYGRLLRPSVLKQLNPDVVRLLNELPAVDPIVSSVLTTAGDLVFVGKPSGTFVALHGRTGAILWQFQTGSGIHSNPVSYSVKGKQYIAVPTGWGGVGGPEMYGAPRGTALVVFALQ